VRTPMSRLAPNPLPLPLKSPSPRNAQRGQLLFEVLIALALIAAAASMVAPRFFRNPAALTAKSAAELAHDTARTAQAQARQRARSVWLGVDIAGARLVPATGATEDAAGETLQSPSTRLALQAETAQEAARDGMPGVLFFGDGGSTGASLTFADTGQTCVLKINWLSGGVDAPVCTPR